MIIDESKKHTKLPKLLSKALELFVAHGIHGTTTAKIAAKAKVAEGTIYRHFKSKDEMAHYIFYMNFSDLTAKLFQAIDSSQDTKEQLRAAIFCFFDYFEQDSLLFTFLLLSRHQELSKFSDSDKTPYDVVLKFIAQGKRSGTIQASNNEIAAALVMGMVVQVADAKVYGRIDKDLRKLAPQVTEACWKVLQK